MELAAKMNSFGIGWGVEVEAIEDIGFDALALNEAGDFPPPTYDFFWLTYQVNYLPFGTLTCPGGQFPGYISLIYKILESC